MSTTSSKSGAFLLEAESRKNTFQGYFDKEDHIDNQQDMVNQGFMKFSTTDRKTVMLDDTGMNEVIVAENEIVDKQIVRFGLPCF